MGKDNTGTDGKTRYRFIRNEIRREIETRVFGPGDRLPSDAELAARFDTSRLTVLRAIRELQDQGLVSRKAGAGTFVLGAAAPATRVFGLLVPDIGAGEVFEPICQGIARAGESAHQTLLWGNLKAFAEQKEREAEELCRYFISRKVAGVFFSPVELTAHQDEVNERIASNLERAGIPIVLLDRDFRCYPDRSRYDLVGVDNWRSGYRLTRHLLQAGARRVAFAFRRGSASSVSARLAGWREALWSANGTAGSGLLFESETFDEPSVRQFLAGAKPDGFVCANDLTATWLMHTLLKLRVRIPEDIRMVGINDVKYARFLPIPLTTLRQPCRDIGAAALKLMLDRLENLEMPARDVLLDCELVVRESCGSSSLHAAAGN